MTYKEELEKLRQKKQLASEKEASVTKEHLEKLRVRRDGLLEHLKLQTADLVGVQVDLNESTGTITLRAPPSPNYICINVDSDRYRLHTAAGTNPTQTASSKNARTRDDIDKYVLAFLERETS